MKFEVQVQDPCSPCNGARFNVTNNGASRACYENVGDAKIACALRNSGLTQVESRDLVEGEIPVEKLYSDLVRVRELREQGDTDPSYWD